MTRLKLFSPIGAIITGILVFNLHLQPFSLALTGQCRNRCENHRLQGNKKAYTLNCEDAYRTELERNYCRRDCTFCPNYVCNDNINRNIFHCPSIEVKWNCRKHCDKNRPKGKSEWYLLNCQAVYKNEKMDSCRNDCDTCPTFVCDSKSNKNLYFCPPAEINQECEQRCEKNRPTGTHAHFEFNCNTTYHGNKTELERCQNDCSTCPTQICDEKLDNNKYNCPAMEHGFVPQNQNRSGVKNITWNMDYLKNTILNFVNPFN